MAGNKDVVKEGVKDVMENSIIEDIVGLKAGSRMNDLKIEALVSILAREGVISRDDFEKEFDSLCGEKEGQGS